jgi:hypothetical protein
MKRVLLVCASLLAVAPAFAQKPQSVTQRWAGSWFGTGQPNDRSQMYIDTFQPDGRFHDHHRQCAKGEIAYEVFETGRWRVENNNLLVIDIATVGGKPDPRTDRYRINSIDDRIQDYTYLANNFGYKARKVNAGFQMPPCDLAS